MGLNVEESYRVLDDIYPDKANRLLAAIPSFNKENKQMDEWREKQLCHLLELTISSVADFRRAYEEQNISKLAWSARNILELSVWIQYCNLSEANAKRFYDDALRDMYGWFRAIHELRTFQEGRRDAELVETLDTLETFATESGITPLGDDFKRVAAA